MRPTIERLEHWVARAQDARLRPHTETSSLDCMQCDLVGISLALGPNDACYIPLGHGGSDMFAERPAQVDRLAAPRSPPCWRAMPTVSNGKYDLNVLARNGVVVAPVDDTMIISSISMPVAS